MFIRILHYTWLLFMCAYSCIRSFMAFMVNKCKRWTCILFRVPMFDPCPHGSIFKSASAHDVRANLYADSQARSYSCFLITYTSISMGTAWQLPTNRLLSFVKNTLKVWKSPISKTSNVDTWQHSMYMRVSILGGSPKSSISLRIFHYKLMETII